MGAEVLASDVMKLAETGHDRDTARLALVTEISP